MNESVFRAYDIRGTIGKNFFLQSVRDAGLAIAYFFKTEYPHVQSIIIGHDPRLHSEYIKQELIQAFLKSGFSVFDNGLSTSPIIYFALHTQPIDAGIMVTASHNGKEDNGIKINIGKHALTSKEIQRIKQYFFEKKSIGTQTTGTLAPISVHDSYTAYLMHQFAHLIGNQTAFIIDCGNGASGIIVKELVRQMNWQNVRVLHAEPDGTFPHHDPDPTHIENMSDVVNCLRHESYQWGVGIDGDADRMAIITKSGTLLSGDIVLALFTKDILRQGKKLTIICNVLASDVIMSQLKKQGAEVYTVPVGNPIMRTMMHEYDACIGGETSGHFFFKDRYFGFDDGIYAMMRFFELYTHIQQSIDDCLKLFPTTFVSPEFRISCAEEEKNEVMTLVKNCFKDHRQSCVDGVRVCFDDGWLLIRPSNTQPVISIRFEMTTKKKFTIVQNKIACALPTYLGNEFIRLCNAMGK